MSNAITDCQYQSVTVKKRTTMVNDSDTDSWKTESDEFERKIALIHYCTNYDEIREDAAKKSNSGPEIRYINPAIYTESVGEKEHDVAQIHRTENDREQENI